MRTIIFLAVLFLSSVFAVSNVSAAKLETSFLIEKDGKLNPVFTQIVNGWVYCFSVYDKAGAKQAIAAYDYKDKNFMEHGSGVKYVPTKVEWVGNVCYFYPASGSKKVLCKVDGLGVASYLIDSGNVGRLTLEKNFLLKNNKGEWRPTYSVTVNEDVYYFMVNTEPKAENIVASHPVGQICLPSYLSVESYLVNGVWYFMQIDNKEKAVCAISSVSLLSDGIRF